MKTIKTYEGFFDFLKKKPSKSVDVQDILDCLYDITDETRIKSELTGHKLDGIFVSNWDVIKKRPTFSLTYDHEDMMDFALGVDTGGLTIRGNCAVFKMQYSPESWQNSSRLSRMRNQSFVAISDEEVSDILTSCQNHLSGYDCQMTFFIGRGFDEGRTWDTEFSDFNKMIEKTINKLAYSQNCIRNVTVKIKSSGKISY